MAERYRIVIVGGGTAGWMTASAMAARLDPASYVVTLVESDEIGTVGVGEATLPHIKLFNDRLAIDEAEFMAATQASFKLGIEFVDWHQPGTRYLHPFGAFGEPWGGVQFQHHWLRARAAACAPGPLATYSFAVQAAAAGAFALPDENPAAIRSTYSYAYHFDAGLYARFLRNWATARGVTRIEGVVTDVARDAASGDLTTITLRTGERIAGDLFVDCSGFRSLLLAQQFDVAWQDWSHWLPCDRALAVPCTRSADFTPFTRSTARRGGWMWRIPLQHRTGNGYVFASAFIDETEARSTLLAGLDGEPLDEPRLLRFSPGRRERAWAGNCVGIGLASGFLEPLESTSIYLIQAAAIDLLTYLPRASGLIDPRLRDEFNRLFELQYDRVRDFLVLHYTANARTGEPLWDYVRDMPLPDTLAHKLALFRSRGAAPDYQYGLFARDSWLSVLIGQGVMPLRFDPLAKAAPLEALRERLDDFRARISAGVAAMPDHAEFVADYCMAEMPPARDAAA